MGDEGAQYESHEVGEESHLGGGKPEPDLDRTRAWGRAGIRVWCGFWGHGGPKTNTRPGYRPFPQTRVLSGSGAGFPPPIICRDARHRLGIGFRFFP